MRLWLELYLTDFGDNTVMAMADTNAAIDALVRVYPVLNALEAYRFRRTVYLALMAS